MAGFNGAGVYQRSYDWTDDKAAAIKIRADRMDTEMDGFATGLSNCICRDGQSTITANLPMNSHKLTGLAAGSAAGDSVRYEQVALLSAGASQTITRTAAGEVLALESTDAGAALGPVASLYRNSASVAANDLGGALNFDFKDTAGNRDTLAAIAARVDDPTSGSEDASLIFRVMTAGSYADELVLIGAALYPAISDGLALGTSSLGFSDLFLASGGVINFNNGDVSLTHSADLLTLSGGNFDTGGNKILTTGLEIGHASDTTLARSSAGRLSVEGVNLTRMSAADASELMASLAGMAATVASDDLIILYDTSAGVFKRQALSAFLTQALDAVFSSTKGAMLYRATSNWAALAPP